MLNCFRGQAYIASLHIVFDVMAKGWPIVFLGYKLTYFFDIEVVCQQIVVIPTNKLCPDDFRDLREALMLPNPIDVVPALLAKLLVSTQLSGLLVFILKLR